MGKFSLFFPWKTAVASYSTEKIAVDEIAIECIEHESS
jgi:hypothetical protein